MYRKGEGVKKDYKKAMELYQKAIQGGDINASHGMGLLYLYGYGVPKNEGKAIELIKESARKGSEGAIDFLRERGIRY